MTPEDFKLLVEQSKSLFITAHVGPDGDTLGSMLALKHAFARVYPALRVDCVISGKMPDVYRFLPGINQVKDVETTTDLLSAYDLSISVDCGSAERLGPAQPYFMGAKTSINIDHHISNLLFAKINHVVPTAAASGEVVDDLFEGMGITLDADTATCLYAALLTDTGGFQYSNTTPKVFTLAAKLSAAGADTAMIYKRIYQDLPHQQVMLYADALLKAHFNPSKTIGWTSITRQLLSAHGALEEHTEGIVEGLRQIDSVKLAAVFKETAEHHTKVSLRSDDANISVAAVVEPFGGGGHKLAAGCTIQAPPEEAAQLIIPRLEAALSAPVH
jgi:phosphoesterase RecJ-like protein